MALSQLDLIRRQLAGAARSQVSREVAGVRRRLSLIGALSRLSRRTGHALDEAARTAGTRRPPRVLPDTPQDVPHSGQVCADGYVRRSPVQPLYTPPDYRRRWVRQSVSAACAVLIALAVLWLLIQYSIISF